MILTFGVGDVIAYPLFDANGSAVALPTPVRLAAVQEFSFEFSGDLKEFYGKGRYALDVAQGKVKASGKLKGAILDGRSLDTLFFGSGLNLPGAMVELYADTTGVPFPANTPYTHKPVPPSGGTYLEDAGVMVDGVTFVRVASSPAKGQYALSVDGTYTFAAADAGKTAYISYRYSYVSASAKRIAFNNLPMGATPRFRLVYCTKYKGKSMYMDLFSVVAPKLNLFGAKNEDYSVPELDFSAQTDASGFNLGELIVNE